VSDHREGECNDVSQPCKKAGERSKAGANGKTRGKTSRGRKREVTGRNGPAATVNGLEFKKVNRVKNDKLK